MLHLVGQTVDRHRAHARAIAGELVPLMRGIYVEAGDDADALVLAHAVRIARHLYPTAYLAGASAVRLGPLSDGRLFVSGRRNQRTRLRALEIVQNQAPPEPSLVTAVVGDDLGELRVEASSPRQRLLEAFRLRSEHAAALDPTMRADLAERLIEEFGSAQVAADALWTLARRLGWLREAESAERFLLSGAPAEPSRNKAAVDLTVAWHGVSQGRLVHDGFEWRWRADPDAAPVLVRQTAPGRLPAFVESLLPEGWLQQVLRPKDERDALRQGRRYLSNVTAAPTVEEVRRLPADVLRAELATFADAGRFIGRYAGPSRDAIERSFEANLAALFAHTETPRLSGVQIKAPMTLGADGVLSPAVDGPFTHILKPAGGAGFEALPLVEWLCLELGRAAGFEVPSTALVDMPDGLPPALLVERFDVRRGPDDRRRLALEDFCSVLDLPSSAKYDGTVERAGRGLRSLSTDPLADLETLFRRALFAWLIADGDTHLKNLALLKVAAARGRRFAAVRMAPLYDTLTTRLFPNLAHDRMALKLNGKDDRLTPDDFRRLANTLELPAARAEAVLAETAAALDRAAPTLALPPFAADSDLGRGLPAQISAIVSARAAAFL